MRIGIDIDDTISNTNELLIEEALKYDREQLDGKGFKNNHAFSFEDMFYWKTKDKEDFLKNNLERIASNVSVKPHAKEIINKLYDEGNEIYIITYRSYLYFKDPFKLSEQWFKNNGIKYTKLIANSGPKGIVCYNNDIDLFIDDTAVHCEDATRYGIKSLLMDSDYNQEETGIKRVYNWEEIYNIIVEKEG